MVLNLRAVVKLQHRCTCLTLTLLCATLQLWNLLELLQLRAQKKYLLWLLSATLRATFNLQPIQFSRTSGNCWPKKSPTVMYNGDHALRVECRRKCCSLQKPCLVKQVALLQENLYSVQYLSFKRLKHLANEIPCVSFTTDHGLRQRLKLNCSLPLLMGLFNLKWNK